jgi:ATP-binding cassette subfamily B (MDR/TAP) protein 1
VGSQLWGEQKQTIAIARALLKNPKILLLDEATFALDKKKEHVIQKTLDNISDDLKTISVTHMPETLRKSDKIYKLIKVYVKDQEISKNFSLKFNDDSFIYFKILNKVKIYKLSWIYNNKKDKLKLRLTINNKTRMKTNKV